VSERGEFAIAVELGTSWIKAALVSARTGARVVVADRPTPWGKYRPLVDQGPFSPGPWLAVVMALTSRLIAHVRARNGTVRVMSIAAISPVWVAFQSDDPMRSMALPYWTPKSTMLDDRAWATHDSQQVLAVLVAAAGRSLSKPKLMVTDLVGYLVFAVTQALTVNTSCLTDAELSQTGFVEIMSSHRLPVPTIGNPLASTNRRVTELPESPEVQFGASDTFCFALASSWFGRARYGLLLGTFACLLRIEDEWATDPMAETIPRPYSWVVSIPRFSGFLDAFARRLTGTISTATALRHLDTLAFESFPHGTPCRLLTPHWDERRREVGKYAWEVRHGTTALSRSELALAALESPAHTIIETYVRAHDESPPCLWALGGGGASSAVWPLILSTVLQTPLVPVNHPANSKYSGAEWLTHYWANHGACSIEGARRVTPRPRRNTETGPLPKGRTA
jgi:sugar (pentulose or hexulose) kinase